MNSETRIAELEMQVSQYEKLFDEISSNVPVSAAGNNVFAKIMAWTNLVGNLQRDKEALATELSAIQKPDSTAEVDPSGFIGPCFHCRDPYFRCLVCEDMGQIGALLYGYRESTRLINFILRTATAAIGPLPEGVASIDAKECLTKIANVIYAIRSETVNKSALDAFLDIDK